MQDELKSLHEKVDRLEQLMLSRDKESLPGSTPRLLNSEELMKLLRISRPTLHKLKQKGKIPFVIAGEGLRYDADAVLRALTKNQKV